MTKTERMREAIRQKQTAAKMAVAWEASSASTTSPPPPAVDAPPEKAVKKKKEKEPPAPRVNFTCGHSVSIKAFKGAPCFGCQKKARRRYWERLNEKRAAKGRLPDGAKFEVAYCAATQLWEGTLTVPGAEPVNGTATAVEWLLRDLALQFREKTVTKPECPC